MTSKRAVEIMRRVWVEGRTISAAEVAEIERATPTMLRDVTLFDRCADVAGIKMDWRKVPYHERASVLFRELDAQARKEGR